MGLIRLNNQSLTDVTTLPAADGSSLTGVSAGKVLQVVSTEKLGAFTTTSNTPVDITGMSVSITPSSTSSKILVMATCGAVCQTSAGQACEIFLMRDSTLIHRSSATDGATRATTVHNGNVNYDVSSMALHTVDSPATTSQVTYKLRMSTQDSGTACFNRRGDDTGGNNSFAKGAAEITVMEIEG